MIDLQTAEVHSTGAYVQFSHRYLFALGAQLYQGCIPVYRIGGHVEPGETGWQGAAREIQEETGLRATPLAPPATCLLCDGDQPEGELETIPWEGEASPAPWLVVAYPRQGEIRLSLMYLAQAEALPHPGAEVKGLVVLNPEEIQQLCQGPLTLGQFLGRGGWAIASQEFDERLVLAPFLQVRLLARLLKMEPTGKTAPDSPNLAR